MTRRSTPSTTSPPDRRQAAARRRARPAKPGDPLPTTVEEIPVGHVPVASAASEGNVDDLLAAMADRAIDRLFTQQIVRPNWPASTSQPPEADLDVELTAEEQAALAQDHPEAPVPLGELVTSMPTDEELEALLRAESLPPAPAEVSRAVRRRNAQEAVAQLAAELNRQMARPG